MNKWKHGFFAILLPAVLFLAVSCHLIAGTVFAAEDYDELVVGNTTHLNGDFFTEMWGNATSDLDVRKLIHSYTLVNWNFEEGRFQTNPIVVSGFVATGNEAGDHTYQISLYQDLQYSDGSPITAWDYAFSILLQLSPQMQQLGAKTGRAQYIQGADAFMEGSADLLSGVRVLNEYEMTVTVDHEYLPYFYELGLLSFQPYPIAEIAPGTVVKDDGDGVYIANEDESAADPVFTAELLEQTILDPDTGYRANPKVTSGPYVLKEFDGTTAKFEINPYFKGDADGGKPSIQTLVYTLAENDSMIGKLESGEVDLLNKVSAQEAIAQGLALTSGNPDFAMSSYPRNGMSFIAFTKGSEPAASLPLRQAIAWCLDRKGISEGYEGNYGLEAVGYYGIGQWMYGLMSGSISYPDAPEGEDEEAYQNEWEALNLDHLSTYSSEDPDADISQAVTILEQDGWTLNEQGDAFDPASDSVRAKMDNGSLKTLRLVLGYPKGSTIAEQLQEYLVDPLAKAGVEVTLQEMDFATILADFYGHAESGADLLFLATNFEEIFDPANNFRMDDEGHACWGGSGIADDRLYDLAVDLRKTTPGDVLSYCRKWIAFQEHFTQTLPLVPIYSNVYFDFYTASLQNYDPMKQVSWSQEILYSFYGDVPVETVSETENLE